MHWTTHIVTGAAWGMLLGRPVTAGVTGIGLHLAFDLVPHKDPEEDTGYITDTLLGLAVLAFLAKSNRMRAADPKRASLFGAIGSCLPDVELAAKLYMNLDDEQLLFPTHNGMLPHPQTGALASSLIQGSVISLFLLAAAWKQMRRHSRATPSSCGPEG